ncbi:insulinase family protein [candidate division KSB1 bacterium]|nr:insulinase family protein [candidate division KSB1 bacterium]
MHRSKSLICFILSLFFIINLAQAADIDIPYKKIVLDNGLTLIVHEDHKAPIVAVNVWYHVGSKNEKEGKTGFAHLFEHLMFNGSENFNDDYFKALEKVGATDLNGTTNEDRTNYFQNVPTPSLDLVLWMESDRMGHLIGAIDQAKLDEQRGVVQNEKRQGENEPYSLADELIAKNCFPVGHPYSWTVIGSMEDLTDASLEDVHEWFKSYYGAANAVLSIAGDIDPETAKKKVEQYFGDIPSGPPVTKHDVWVAKRTGTHRQIAQDRVPQARIMKIWNIPQWGSADADYLDLASDVLASGKTSRLFKRLVYTDQIATSAAAFVDLREIGGLFTIQADAKPGVSLEKVEQAIDEELAKFLAEGPTEAELKRIKTQYVANFIRGSERIGGFGGKSDILARNEVFAGNPEHYKTTLNRVQNATADNLLKAAKTWLSDGVYILEIHPFPDYKTVASTVDRSKLPVESGTAPKVQFPALQRKTLSNGLKIILAERSTIPVVNFNLMVDAGYAADQSERPGTASLAMDMMDEGTATRSALQISEGLAMLGAQLGTGSNLDVSTVFLSALKDNLDASLDIFADVILNPSFPKDEFTRLQKQRLAGIQQEKASPITMAIRVFPKLIYGSGHAYSNPFTGSGNEASVSKMTVSDLQKFHHEWFKPNNATLVVVGATTMNEMAPKLEKLFANWKKGKVPAKNIGEVKLAASSEVYLIDKPGAQQSMILAGHIAPPKSHPEEIAMDMMNLTLGGKFTSRINMNLREDKHWTYGARSLFLAAQGQRPFIAYTPVQSDKTKEAIIEIKKEFSDIISTRPVTADEFSKTQENEVLRLPGSWETANAIAGSIGNIVQFNLPDNYYQTYPEKVKNLKLADVVKAAKTVVRPENVTWIVVGDKEKVAPAIKELGFGEIKLIDTDGNPVK